jgi:hypothetical protein
VGVIGQDLFDTNVTYSSGDGTAVAYPMNFRGSISYSPISSAIVAFDSDDRWHVGAEYRPTPILALRAGLQDDWESPEGVNWSAGAGVKAGFLRIDYALLQHPTLGSTHYFGVSFEFNFNPSQVRIERVEPHDLFASLQKTYARQPVATLRIRNLDDRPLSTKVRVMIPELMDRPTEEDVILRPKATEEIALPAVLGDRAMERNENRPIHVRVSATYQGARLQRTETASASGVLYGPGAIDWGRGVDQAAAFITTRDPSVDGLAREATRLAALMPPSPGASRNVAFSAAIIDALASMGLAYVPDPNNPYSAISATHGAVDTISYPRETLARRTGDCDDTSVLVASLLGNVGIATKLVDVPGHIFVLADAGVHERNRLGLGLPDERTVVADEEVWIPLETTSIGKGFAEAWREGADSYAAWSARGRLALVDVESAFDRYEPVEPRSAPAALPPFDAPVIRERISADLATVAGWRDAYLTERYGAHRTVGAPSSGALNQIARVQFMAGQFADARHSLEQAATEDQARAATWNNLGTVLAVDGDLAGAAAHYRHALQLDGSDGGIWLNLGLVQYAMGDTAAAGPALAKGIQLSGGITGACALLALVPASDPTRGSGQKMTDAEMRELLLAAVHKVPAAGKNPSGNPPASTAASKPNAANGWTSRVAGGRSAEGDALHQHLYWKEP